MAKKETVQSNSGSIFNLKPIHVVRIKALLDAGYDKVIIHGDGMMFAGKTNQSFDGKLMEEGSDHHKEFNAGVAEINKDEVISRAKFRAVYKRGDKLPVSIDEIEKEFYDNQAREMKNAVKPEEYKGFSNAVTLSDPKPESKPAE